MDLSIALETVCRLIVRARELEARVPVDDPAAADDPVTVPEDETDSAAEAEARALLDDLAEDEVGEVLALAWVGRGTYDASEWDEALEEAGASGDPVAQLLDLPMLAAYLDAGLAAFDLSCDGIDPID